METLIFDNATVKAHPIYPDCGASLHDVSKRDYPSDDFFDERIECLDVDGYETLVCKKHRKTKQPTADAVIGVRSHLGGRTVLQARVDGRGAEDEIPKS